MSEQEVHISDSPPDLESMRATHGTLGIIEQLAQIEERDIARHRARFEWAAARDSETLAYALREFVRQAARACGPTPAARNPSVRDPDRQAWSGHRARVRGTR
jgi:hypothetical protein